ncbi:MAG TPA: hypothetical protein VK211_18715 [Kamptonema sp.]|nr:hypothetical protein [Kamptonema sp.]
MLTTVLIINVLISLLCFYIAWKVWQVRRVLSRVESTLTVMERRSHNILSQAPEFLVKREKSVRKLRQQYQQLESQVQQLQQVLGLLTLGGTLWRSRSQRFR